MLGHAATADAQTADTYELTLDQARGMAVYALQNGDPGLAIQLSRGLLQADPDDASAHYIIASAHARLNQPLQGRRAAARAYRHFDRDADRFQAAQLAARLAYAEGRPTLTQFWLRRTVIHAPTKADEERVARDYRTLRRINPWSFRLRTDLRPSNNVNNGSDTALQIIDGVPVIGTLSGAAQALSGLIASADLFTGYRLRGDADSTTSLGARLYVQRVALSDAAQAKAPLARNSDFATTYGEVSLRHAFTVGPPESGGTAAVDLALGDTWSGGQRDYSFARVGAERNWQLSDRSRLTLDATAETRFNVLYRVNDAQILGLGAEFAHRLQNGDRFTLSMALRDTDAESPNGTYTSASMRAGYAFGRPVGPAQLSAGLVLGYSDYPVFRSGLFFVPGGRQDRSAYGDVSLFFDQLDYAGFAPLLRVRSGRKSSNDSRFDTREISVSLSIESKF